jgi:hypothetical protein
MTRSMKLGLATIVAVFAVSLLVTEDAEARHRRFGRHRRGGCCGYTAPSCCGAAAAPACQPACGVATSACPGGACGVAGGAYHGGHTTGYGAAPGVVNGQTTPSQPTPAINGESTFRQDQAPPNGAGQNGAVRSPSDRPPAPAGAANGSAVPPAEGGGTSAPPPPQDQ